MLKHIIQSSKITAYSITQNISQTISCLNLETQNQILTSQSIYYFIFKYLQQREFFKTLLLIINFVLQKKKKNEMVRDKFEMNKLDINTKNNTLDM